MEGIKFAGISMIIISSALIGVYAGENVRTRVRMLVSLRRLLVLVRGEINYSMPVLHELFAYIADHCDDIWHDYFQKISERLMKADSYSEIDEMWENVAYSLNLNKIMYSTDFESLIRFGKDMSSYDKESLVRRIDMYISVIESRIDELSPDVNNRVRMCRMLGIVSGVFITILIV